MADDRDPRRPWWAQILLILCVVTFATFALGASAIVLAARAFPFLPSQSEPCQYLERLMDAQGVREFDPIPTLLPKASRTADL